MWDKSPSLINTHFEKLVNGNKVQIGSPPRRSHAYIFRLLTEVLSSAQLGKDDTKTVWVADCHTPSPQRILSHHLWFWTGCFSSSIRQMVRTQLHGFRDVLNTPRALHKCSRYPNTAIKPQDDQLLLSLQISHKQTKFEVQVSLHFGGGLFFGIVSGTPHYPDRGTPLLTALQVPDRGKFRAGVPVNFKEHATQHMVVWLCGE